MVDNVIDYPVRINAGEESLGPEPLDKRLGIGKDHDGLKTALTKLNIDVRLNTRNQRIEYKRDGLAGNEKVSHLPMEEWQAQTKHVDAAIRAAILDDFKFHNGKDESHAKWGRESYEENINSIVFGKQVDPFKEWLEALDPWDNSNRLPQIHRRDDYAAAERVSVLTATRLTLRLMSSGYALCSSTSCCWQIPQKNPR